MSAKNQKKTNQAGNTGGNIKGNSKAGTNGNQKGRPQVNYKAGTKGNPKAAARQPEFSRWFLLPPALMLAVVPIIMRYHEFDNKLMEFGWMASDTTIDFFLYYKMIAIIILGVVMLCIVAGRLFLDGSKTKFSRAFIPMMVYALFIIISALASQYPQFVSSGIREQFESVWVLLSYCIMAYYCFLFVNTEKDVENLFFCLFIGSAVICLIGVFQFFNGYVKADELGNKVQLDLFRTEFGQKLILPKSLWNRYIYPEDSTQRLSFTFPEGRAYVTLYNPNYVGMYASLMIPCLTAWMITRKNKLHLIAPAVLMAGLFITLYSAGAKNGVVALVLGALLYAAAYRRVFLKKPLLCIGALAFVIAFFFVSDHVLGNSITNGIKGLFNKEGSHTEGKLEKIVTGDEDVVVYYGGNELHVSSISDETGQYLYAQVSDSDGKPVDYRVDEETGVIILTDERFEGISVYSAPAEGLDIMLLAVYIDDESIEEENYKYFFFSNQVPGDGGYYNYNSAWNFVKMENSETGLFGDNPKLFSGRGYIWSKTIPLLKKYIFAGSGPDTFEVAFPQNDSVSMRQGGYGGMIITKPHNLFLQIGVNTGVISLIGFLLFFIIYFVWSFKLFIIKEPDSYMAHMGVGILCGNTGYIISGIINDSTVCVAPIYWCLMGIGIAINVYCEKNKKAEPVKKPEKKTDEKKV